MLHRRHVMQLLAGAGAAAWAGPRGSLAQTRAAPTRPLAIPPLVEGRPGPAGRVHDLEIRAGNSEFLAGRTTPTIGVNGAYLGPTIRCAAGDAVAFNVTNALTEPTTLHWHGLHVPAAQDGGPHQEIAPGATWRPAFPIKQAASICWYHSHLMGHTGEQVLRGLAGLFIVEDAETKALGLPEEYGVDDIPLVIQDRRFGPSGELEYLTSMHDQMFGYLGDVVMVNGTVAPHLDLSRRRTRLRILNGSNARFYNLGRQDGRELVLIAGDGGLLPAPVRLRRLRLAPGERAELLLDAEPDSSIVLMSYPDDAPRGMARGMGPMMMGPMAQAQGTFPVLEMRAGALERTARELPARLGAPPPWSTRKADRTRTFTLEMGMMGGVARGMGGMMSINGRAMDPERIDERIPLGSVEIWEIRNATPLAHPFHIHDVQFLVIERDGRPPLPQERGLKDTIVVEPGGTVKVKAEFADYADANLPYMYHCHILEHEDAGMMGQFVVV